MPVSYAHAATFSVSPTEISLGETVTFSWSAQTGTCYLYDTTSGTVNTGIYGSGVNGSRTYKPTTLGAKTYTLYCDAAPYQTATLTVNAPAENPATINDFSISSSTILTGESATLSWETENATSCTASGAWEGTKATIGSEPVSPATAGDYSYTLTCEGAEGSPATQTKTLKVQGAPEYPYVTRASRVASGGSAVPADGLILGTGFYLFGYVNAATSCHAEGQDAPAGNLTLQNSQYADKEFSQLITPTIAGEHTYQVICENSAGSTTSNSVTVKINEPVAEQPIELSNARFELNSFYSDFYVTMPKYVGADATNMKSGVQCSATVEYPDGEIKTLTSSSYGSGSSFKIAIDSGLVSTYMAGTYTATNLSCTNLDGVQSNVIAGPITMEVQGAPQIVSFEIDDDNIQTSQSSTLRWESENTVSCDLTNAETGVTETGLPSTGSAEFAARPRAGNYNYNLVCYSAVSYQGSPLNKSQSLTVAVSAEPFNHSQVSGQYLGAYYLFVGVQQDTGGAGAQMKGNMCTVGEDGSICPAGGSRMNGMLGRTIEPAYWLWDFDEGKIYLGSSTLQALLSSYVPYRLYDPSRNKFASQVKPEDRPELWQMMGTFEPSNEQAHVYHVKFNMQFFMAMAGYPLAKLELRMGIANNGDGTLYIGTLSGHPDSKDPGHYFKDPYAVYRTNGFNPGGCASGRCSVNFGSDVLGVVLPNSDDYGDPEGITPAYNSFAPFRVSPLFGAMSMAKVQASEDCDNGLPVEFYRQLLRLSGDKDTVCGAIPVVNGEMDSDADGVSDIAEVAGVNADAGEQASVRNGGYVMPIKRDGQHDFLQPVEFWRKPQFAGLISLGNGERAVLYTRHNENDPEDSQLALGDYRKYFPGVVWEPVPKALFGETDYLYLPAPARLPANIRVDPVSSGLNIRQDVLYELGSLHIPSAYHAEDRQGYFYLYFNKGVPEGLKLYELGESFVWSYWNVEQFEIHPERLCAADDQGCIDNEPGYNTTVRFKLPPIVQGRTATAAHIAIGHHNPNLTGSTQPRTDVAFDPQEPGYVALLEKAAQWTYEEPALAKVGHLYVNGKSSDWRDDETVVKLGDTVTFSWGVNNTGQCYVGRADWSDLDGSQSIEWKNAQDSWTTPPFDREGVYRYQLVCDPGFAVGDEPEVVTIRVLKDGDSEDLSPPTQGAGTKPKAGSFGLAIFMVMFAAVLRRRASQ